MGRLRVRQGPSPLYETRHPRPNRHRVLQRPAQHQRRRHVRIPPPPPEISGMTMRVLLTLFLATVALAQQRRTIFLITDAEGVGGVCRQDQTEPTNQEMRQLLTGEINAAVEGFYAGGADEVVVWDGHDGSQTLSTLTIHPKSRLVMGALNASMLM